MLIQRYPLQWPAGWPRARVQIRARFNTKNRLHSTATPGYSYNVAKDLTVSGAIERVILELERLGVEGHEAVISTNLALRLDGLPRSGQPEPQDPGAAVYWRTLRGATKVMAIDTYDRVAGNLAAIAATLAAMRAIERHGGAQILDRAFTGFDALPAPAAFDCWRELGLDPGDTDSVEAAFRDLAKRRHPDMPGGSTEAFQRLERARREALGAA